MTPPPYPSLPEARRVAGETGVRAVLAWVVAEHPPGRSTLLDAAMALGARDREAARHVARGLTRAANALGEPLPAYPRGTPRGTVALERRENKRSAKIDTTH